jgi:hypothetical protein
MRGMVKYAAKYKNPRLLESGMNCFMGILRGPHLVAHTWASRPTLIWGFVDNWPISVASFPLNRWVIIAQKSLFVDRRYGDFSQNMDTCGKDSLQGLALPASFR